MLLNQILTPFFKWQQRARAGAGAGFEARAGAKIRGKVELEPKKIILAPQHCYKLCGINSLADSKLPGIFGYIGDMNLFPMGKNFICFLQKSYN